MEYNTEIWAFCEVEDHHVTKRSRNLLAKARELCNNYHYHLGAIIIDDYYKTICDQELMLEGVCNAYCHKSLDKPSYQNFAEILERMVRKYTPSILLFSTSHVAKTLSALVAARVNTGLTADCIDLDIDPEENLLIQSRLVLSERKIAKIITPDHTPQMATVLYNDNYENQHKIDKIKQINIYNCTSTAPSYNNTDEFLEQIINPIDTRQLEMNDIIIAGGLGLGSKEKFQLLKKVSQKLKASVGATRAAVDMGWIEEKALVGMSGAVVNPLLYIAFGISGSMQHLLGMHNSKTIVSVNTDANAPINLYSDYIFITDANKLLIELNEKLK